MKEFVVMKLDLPEYGKIELTFEELNITTDEDYAYHLERHASYYFWYASILNQLNKLLKQKKLDYRTYVADKIKEIKQNRKELKTTVKDLEAIVDSDRTAKFLSNEIINLEAQVERIKDFLYAMSQRHSALIELSQRERWGLSQYSQSDNA